MDEIIIRRRKIDIGFTEQPPPLHEWDGKKIRFKFPNGEWGAWIDLGGVTSINASNVILDTTNFEDNLGGADNTVQKAMGTLDKAIQSIKGESINNLFR